jgi:hypothetical protein
MAASHRRESPAIHATPLLITSMLISAHRTSVFVTNLVTNPITAAPQIPMQTTTSIRRSLNNQIKDHFGGTAKGAHSDVRLLPDYDNPIGDVNLS